jgi:hypothetical protein
MRYLFLALFCIATFSSGFAQKDSNSVTVTYSKVTYHRAERDKNIYNLIKINPLLVLNGDIPIYYERRIMDRLSIEGAIGITHMDYIYQGITTENYEEERRAKLGYSLMISAKFYPSNHTKALDEIYFGPEIRHRRYNTEVEDCGNTSLTGFIPEYRTLTDFKLTVGYISYISDNVIFDFYGGVGLRSRNISYAYCDDIYNGSSYNAVMEFEKINDFVPIISAGIKIGFAF